MDTALLDLFALADQARLQDSFETGDDVVANDAEADAVFENPKRKIRTGAPKFCINVDGDVHLCFGQQCEHAVLDREHNWICAISGEVIGTECSGEKDPSWTGRSTGSANPDDCGGTPVGGWIKRRDMYAASVAAYRSAHTISDAVVAQPARSAPTTQVKRGALCVDEEEVAPIPKRPRSSRKENWNRDALEKLASEALGVIDKLFIFSLAEKVAAKAKSAKPAP